MGLFDWFGGGSSSSSSNKESDPLRNLDPNLREFLSRESPVKYTTAADSQQQDPEYQQQQQQKLQQQRHLEQLQQQQSSQPEPLVPRESLYQDGRYAHIWKTYKPKSVIDAETKTDHEKLMDVLDGYKSRKAQIGKAALENCAEEQLDWNNCMKSGNWVSRMTMCRDEVQKFERCYTTQSVRP